MFTYQLNKGVGKNGREWFTVRVIIGDYESEPIFLRVLEYNYLQRLLDESAKKDFLTKD